MRGVDKGDEMRNSGNYFYSNSLRYVSGEESCKL